MGFTNDHNFSVTKTKPTSLTDEFEADLERFEREIQMPYVISIEHKAIRQGLIEGIELGLELKFGNEGLQLLPEISQIDDIETLRGIRDAIKRVITLKELHTAY